MPSEDLVTITTLIVVVAVAGLYSYGSYWAFRIRQVLFDRLYRERAQWAGTTGALLTGLAASYLMIGLFGANNFYLSFFQYLIDDLAAIVTFAWVDATVIMARRLDPLGRGIIRWNYLRIVLWAFLTIATVGGLTSVVLTRAIFFSPQGGQGVLLSGPFGFSTIGFIAVIISWRRSRHVALRAHLKWFALYLLTLSIASASTGGVYLASLSVLRLVSALSLALGAYFLYRASKSLALVSKRVIEGEAYVEAGSVKS